ncbi:MAG: ATP-binding protein [bacterium]
MTYKRKLQNIIEENLFKGKLIILYGARRVGKTTLCKTIIGNHKNSKYINCELEENRLQLETTNSLKLKDFLGNYKLIVLDEAHKIKDIGLILKILVDTFPEIQIIATGSSSFTLADKASEPLTGRTRTYVMYPLSFQEINSQFGIAKATGKLENILRYGSYPSVFTLPENEAVDELNEISNKYLYQDILEIEGIKRKNLILKILRALAFQIGNEVSLREIAELVGESDHHIVDRYIATLEECFVLFRLTPYSKNLRKEIGSKNKYYFWDLGMRNSLIQQYNHLELRNDVGALWENYCISERLKLNMNTRRHANTYFWRTYDQKEIDYIEEYDGKLEAYEFKWKDNKAKNVSEFLKTYENSSFKLINKDNFLEFIL